jgi:hypothetical protein
VPGDEQLLHGAGANEAGAAQDEDAHRKKDAVSSLTTPHKLRPEARSRKRT